MRFLTPSTRLLASLSLALFLLPSGLVGQEADAGPETELSAEVRARTEAQTVGPDRDLDADTWLRSRLAVDLAQDGIGRLFVQVQDARRFGEELSTMDASAEALDLHQAYLELGDAWSGLEARARVGRQEVRWGGERLIGAVGWSNTGRSFDGLRASLTSPDVGWTVEGLAVVVTDRDGPGREVEDRLLSGLRATAGQAALSLLREDGYRDGTSAVDRSRYTAHLTLDGELPAGLSARAEGAYQWGDRADGSVSAGMAGIRLRRRSPRAVVPFVSVGADWLSGDGVVGDGRRTSFSTLFATNHKFYGYQDFFLDVPAATARRGLVDLRARADLELHPDVSLRVEPHAFVTAEATADDARALGRELDLTLPVSLPGAASLQLGYSVFWPDAAAREVGLAAGDRAHHWGYAQTSLAF